MPFASESDKERPDTAIASDHHEAGRGPRAVHVERLPTAQLIRGPLRAELAADQGELLQGHALEQQELQQRKRREEQVRERRSAHAVAQCGPVAAKRERQADGAAERSAQQREQAVQRQQRAEVQPQHERALQQVHDDSGRRRAVPGERGGRGRLEQQRGRRGSRAARHQGQELQREARLQD